MYTKKFYVHEIAVVNLSKNAKKTCKPNNLDLSRDWIKENLRNKEDIEKITKYGLRIALFKS